MGGDPPATPVGESTAEMLQAYLGALPKLLSATENAQLKSSQITSPAYQALQNQLYQTFGPGLAKTSSDIEAQNALRQAQSDLAVVSGPGRDLVKEALVSQKLVDPEYYAGRGALGESLLSLLSGLNPNGLSSGEREEITRSNAQQDVARGNLNTPSATATTENAMNFGNALNAKRTNIANILGTAGGILPALQSGTDVYQVATGKPSTSNLGDSKFSGVKTNTETGTNLLSSLSGLTSQSNELEANRRDNLDRVMQGFGGVGSL